MNANNRGVEVDRVLPPETRKNRPDFAISTTTEGPVSQISAKVPCANELAALETWLVGLLADALVADYRIVGSPSGTDHRGGRG